MITRPATMSDAEAVVEIFNLCSLEITGKPEFSVEEIRGDWQTPGFSLETDTVVVLTPQDQIVGYGDLWGSSATFTRFISWVRVHPGFQGQGIGTYLNRWVETRARQDVDKAPEEARVVLRTHVSLANIAAQELLQALGMVPVRYAWRMEITLDKEPPTPQWPDGITVRLRKPGEERTFYEVRCAAFRDHWGYIEEPFEQGFARWKHLVQSDPHYDPSLWYLAEDRGQIAGFAICAPRIEEEPDMAWIHWLGVLRPWRRRGLGSALLLHAFGEFYRRGIRRAGLGVDAQSLTGASRLYEKAGMRVTQQYVTFEKELRPGKDLSTREISDG
jgi:mycothiol synthase